MDWYYAKNGEPATGPFDDGKFAELVQNGTVQPNTMVWNASLQQWLPCRQAYPSGTGPATASLSSSVAASLAAVNAPNLLACPNCNSPLPWQWQEGVRSSQATGICPKCRMEAETLVFPALHAKIESGRNADKMVLDGDATCYNHPAAKAEIVCSHCGRFLCALCDMEIGGVHSCPSCLTMPKDGKPKAGASGLANKLERRRIRYDQVALILAVLGVITCWLGFILCPAAIITAIIGLRRPGSLLGKNRGMLWTAIVISALDLLLIVGFIVFLIVEGK